MESTESGSNSPALPADIAAEMNDILNGNSNKGKKRRGKLRLKRLIPIGVILIIAGFFIYSNLNKSQAPQVIYVSADPLVKGDIVQTLALNGPISGTDSVDVVSNLHAEITDILVKEGDHVEKDQVLAVLDTTDLQKEVERAENSYNLAKSTYNERAKELQNSYEKAVQDYEIAKTNLERTQALFDAGDIPLVDLETAQNTLNDASRQMNSFATSKGKVVVGDSYTLQIDSAAFDLEQKKENLVNAQIKSPIAGTVVRVNSKIGRFADKTENDKPMFIIENLDVLEMEINVSEYSIGKISLGQKVNITADILNGNMVSGEVTAISPTGEEKSGSTERVIPITIRILDSHTNLIAGINAKAEIILDEAKNTFLVPSSSILQREDGTLCIVTVDETGKIHLVDIETGVENDFQTEIFPKEGYILEENILVVNNPTLSLTEGLTVSLMPNQ